MDIIVAGYIIFTILLVLTLLFNYLFVKYYLDPNESYFLGTLVIISSLSVTLICVLIIPIDILLAADSVEGIDKVNNETVREIILSLFTIMLVLAFVLTPFAYFYGEEVYDEIDSDFESNCERICESCKYTAVTMLVCSILMIIGLIFRPEKGDWGQGKEWVQKLFDVEHVGEAAISFTVAGLTVIGGGMWSFYTAYGMAALPLLLIKGTKSLEEAKNEIETDLVQIKDKIKEIELRSTKSNTGLTRKEKKEKASLERQQKKMLMKSEKISDKQKDTSQIISTVLRYLTPFRVMIGLVGFTISLLFLMSLILGCINRLISSECGFSCGFIASRSSLFNPLDALLVYISYYFPLDYFLFSAVILYIFISSLFGIVNWGIRFFCFNVFTI
jgi:LMBR1 domain-containing protein 1